MRFPVPEVVMQLRHILLSFSGAFIGRPHDNDALSAQEGFGEVKAYLFWPLFKFSYNPRMTCCWSSKGDLGSPGSAGFCADAVNAQQICGEINSVSLIH